MYKPILPRHMCNVHWISHALPENIYTVHPRHASLSPLLPLLHRFLYPSYLYQSNIFHFQDHSTTTSFFTFNLLLLPCKYIQESLYPFSIYFYDAQCRGCSKWHIFFASLQNNQDHSWVTDAQIEQQNLLNLISGPCNSSTEDRLLRSANLAITKIIFV